MAETQSGGGSGAGMGVVVGILLALVLVIGAVVFFGGGMLNHHKTVDLNVNLPTAPSAPSIPAPSVPKPQ